MSFWNSKVHHHLHTMCHCILFIVSSNQSTFPPHKLPRTLQFSNKHVVYISCYIHAFYSSLNFSSLVTLGEECRLLSKVCTLLHPPPPKKNTLNLCFSLNVRDKVHTHNRKQQISHYIHRAFCLI
jgi:hypothetical protein